MPRNRRSDVSPDVCGASQILVAKSGILLGSILIADHLYPINRAAKGYGHEDHPSHR
jgi:hypothetical protein